MPTDCELLRQYAEQMDESAFAEVVSRHTDLVYSVALRVSRSPQLAEDVTQKVFTKLAQQAGRLGHYETIIGWLHTAARHGAIDAIRGEERRRTREQEASAMQIPSPTPELNWESVGPLLDEAVSRLREDDRQAVLLRFFKNQSHHEVGAALGLSEDTARKRVERAVEKLRAYFSARGVTTTSAILASAMSANSVHAAPAGLAEKVAPVSLAGASGGSWVGSAFLLTLLSMSTKIKTILAFAALAILAGLIALKWPHPDDTVSAVAPAPAAKDPAHAVALSKPVTSTSPVAAPVAAPARPQASADSAAVAAVPPTAAAVNADLKTSIPALIHFLETDNFAGVIDFVLLPEELANMLKAGRTREEVGDLLRKELAAHGGTTPLLNALRMVETREPSYDETSTHATYKLEVPFAGHNEIEFIKVDGLWYGPN